MPKIAITADTELVTALRDDASKLFSNPERVQGTIAESERLGFELGSIETLIAHVAAAVEAVAIARHFLAAARRSNHPKMEIISPTGRVSLDLTGKSEEEVAAVVKAVMPFTR